MSITRQASGGKVYFPTVNLLRGIATLLVCFYHFVYYKDTHGTLFPPGSAILKAGDYGYYGVFMFFVISGFVIPFSMAQSGFKFKYLHHFLARRFIRIEMPYVVAIGLILLAGYFFALKNGESFTVEPLRILYHIIFVIPFTAYNWYNPIFWTLGIEFQFYVLIGLLYALVTHKNKVVQYGTLVLFGDSGFMLGDVRYVFVYSLFFLQGIVLFLIMTKRINRVIGWIFIVVCTGINLYHFLGVEIICSIIAVLSIAFLNINNKWSNLFGSVSYSLYLTHGLIGMNFIYLLMRYVENVGIKYLLVALAIILSLLFAYVFWKYVEEPSAKLSKKVKIKSGDD
jgi:peptidoglycan/LPS O-acetylase OafA/YrhL